MREMNSGVLSQPEIQWIRRPPSPIGGGSIISCVSISCAHTEKQYHNIDVSLGHYIADSGSLSWYRYLYYWHTCCVAKCGKFNIFCNDTWSKQVVPYIYSTEFLEWEGVDWKVIILYMFESHPLRKTYLRRPVLRYHWVIHARSRVQCNVHATCMLILLTYFEVLQQ